MATVEDRYAAETDLHNFLLSRDIQARLKYLRQDTGGFYFKASEVEGQPEVEYIVPCSGDIHRILSQEDTA